MPAKMVAKAKAPKNLEVVVRPESRDRISNLSGEAIAGLPVALPASLNRGTAQVKFDDGHRWSLRHAGLTGQQIVWLERVLPLIRDALSKRPRNNDVVDEVTKLRGILKKADSAMRILADASRRRQPESAARAAFNYLGLAASTVDRRRALDGIEALDDSQPVLLDIQVMVRLALAVCNKALEAEVPQGQRVRHSSAPAVKRIVQAIHRPTDGNSRDAAMRLMAPNGHSNFMLVCELVFDLFGARGRVEYAVKQYRRGG